MTINTKRSKLLIIARNLPIKGKRGNPIILETAKRLREYIDVELVFPKEFVPFFLKYHPKYRELYGLKTWSNQGLEIRTLNYLRLPMFSNAFALTKGDNSVGMRLMKELKPNIIHAQYGLPDGLIANQLAKRFMLPFVCTIRATDIKYLSRVTKNSHLFKQYQQVLHSAKVVFVHNLGHQDLLKKHFNVESALMPHGTDLPEDQITQKNKDITRVVSVAELVPRKQHKWIINAIRSYEGKKKLELVIVGSGPLDRELKELCEGLKNVSFTGQLAKEEVQTHLRNADIFALPSYDETFGLVYLEAACHHNAIIGLENEGVWGHFKNDDEMLFVNSYEEFEVQIHQLIDDEIRRNRLAKNALSRVNEYSWDRIIPAYLQHYEEVLSK